MTTVTIDFRAITRWLRVLITPSVWVVLGSYNREWDRTLRHLLRTQDFKRVDDFTAHIGGVEVWVENRPYGAMRPYIRRPLDIRASRATVLEALDRYDRDVIKHITWSAAS